MKTAALIMMDLDDLKYINDTYGHDYGDQYIRCAADCFITFTPKSTVVARYSGDEFFLFFYGYDSKEEIRSKIADMRAGIKQQDHCASLSAAPQPENFRWHRLVSGRQHIA